MRRLFVFTALVVAGAGLTAGAAAADESPLAVGSPMPAFSLPDAGGGSVSLEALIKNGPAVIVIYRGVW